jgi:hypothetical protein
MPTIEALPALPAAPSLALVNEEMYLTQVPGSDTSLTPAVHHLSAHEGSGAANTPAGCGICTQRFDKRTEDYVTGRFG